MENSKAICPPQQEGTKKRFCIVNRGETTMLCIQGWVFKKPHLVSERARICRVYLTLSFGALSLE